jgi:hypothetical protein
MDQHEHDRVRSDYSQHEVVKEARRGAVKDGATEAARWPVILGL